MKNITNRFNRGLDWLQSKSDNAQIARQFLSIIGLLIGIITVIAALDIVGLLAWYYSALVVALGGLLIDASKVIRKRQQRMRRHETVSPVDLTSPPRTSGDQPTQLLATSLRSHADPSLQTVELLRRLVELTEQGPTLAEDDVVYWNRHPHVKHFIKRMWRIVLAWIFALSTIVLPAVNQMYGIVHLSLDMAALSLLFSALSFLGAAWYTKRRILKWKGLRLRIQGNWFYIDEPVSSWFLLNGQTHKVPIIVCNNAKTKKTLFERIFGLNCGLIDINTPIDHEDWFRNLKDVSDFEELSALIVRRHDEILSNLSGGGLRQQLNL